MTYDGVWKTLDALILELRKRGSTVAQGVVDDLKTARTLINIHNVDPSSTETIMQIENYLRKVESTLLFLVEADYDAEYAEDILKRISRARKPRVADDESTPSRLITGVLPGQHWVRIDTRDIVSRESLTKLTAELGLTLKMQGADHAVISGDKTIVKQLLKKIAEKTRSSR